MSKKTDVMQSNKITNGVYSMGLQHKRLINLCILKSNDKGLAIFTTSEYSEYFDITTKLARTLIIAQKTSILIPKVIVDQKDGSFDAFTWVQRFSFTDKKNQFEVQFSDRITQEISMLKNNFTKFSLLEVGRIKNVNTVRLYESLSQWKNTGVWVTTPDELHSMFELPDSYKAYSQMKDKFLLPACNEISEKTSLFVNFVASKKGNKVATLTFSIFDKKDVT